MSSGVRWTLLVVAVVLVVAMVAYARGPVGHRGDEVDSPTPVVAT